MNIDSLTNGLKRVKLNDENILGLSNNIKCQPQQVPFLPVSNYKDYLEEKLYMDVRSVDYFITSDENKTRLRTDFTKKVENLRQKHVDYYNSLPLKENVVPPPRQQENTIGVAAVKLTVKRNKLKVCIIAPLDTLYHKYTRKGHTIPIEEKIKAMYEMGYSKNAMTMELKRNDKVVKWQEEATKIFDVVFAKYGKSKSVSKPKKVTPLQKIQKSMKTLAISVSKENEDN